MPSGLLFIRERALHFGGHRQRSAFFCVCFDHGGRFYRYLAQAVVYGTHGFCVIFRVYCARVFVAAFLISRVEFRFGMENADPPLPPTPAPFFFYGFLLYVRGDTTRWGAENATVATCTTTSGGTGNGEDVVGLQPISNLKYCYIDSLLIAY